MNDTLDCVEVQLQTGDYLAGRRDAIKEVLEIIDEISDSTCITFGTMTYSDGKGELRNRVMALKGEQE